MNHARCTCGSPASGNYITRDIWAWLRKYKVKFKSISEDFDLYNQGNCTAERDGSCATFIPTRRCINSVVQTSREQVLGSPCTSLPRKCEVGLKALLQRVVVRLKRMQ